MLRSSAILSVLILTALSTLSAAVVNVPEDFPTIQEALDSQLLYDGDTILVHPGTYRENIDFHGRSIQLASLFLVTGDRSYIGSTVIDGGSSGSVIRFADDRKSIAAVIGFTVLNGSAENGGGIYCRDSRPLICHNIIKNNTAGREGGGIFCLRSDPEISDNLITDNQGVQGGGICYRDLNMMTAGIGSARYEGYFKPGSAFDEDKIADLDHNIITGNYGRRGGGIYCVNSKLSLINEAITENSADLGSGVYCARSDIKMTSTIVWSNYPAEDPQIWGDSLVAAYSDIQGGWPGDGNIDLNPCFRGPQYGDFRLMSVACGDDYNSPCIDAGSPESSDSLVECSRGLGTAFCDMGPYGGRGPERPSETLLRIPFDFDTPQLGINASSDGDTVLVYPGIYPGNIDFNGREITLASLYIMNPVPELVSSTIINGQSDGPVVTFESGETESACLAGLTLRDGLAVNGGGVYCHYSRPTIAGNIIESNTALSDGGGIFCFFSDPVVEGNVMRSNHAVSGAGILCRYSSPVIRGNQFNGNRAQQDGGAILCRDNSLPVIERNMVTQNSAGRGGGIVCRYTSPSISGNVIHSNESGSGGGLYCVGSAPSLVNDAIVGNYADTGGGLFCLNSAPVILNSILYFNQAAEGGQISGGQPLVSFSDVQGGWDGIGNIDSDPLFSTLDGREFNLSSMTCGDQADSPCIDSGHPDISDSLLACDWGLGDTRSDMGAYGGGHTSTAADPPAPTSASSCEILGSYPNPFNTSTTILYRLPNTGRARVEIFDICGRLVDVLETGFSGTAAGTVVWDGGGLAAGVYFARLNGGPSTRAMKLLLVK